jgi:hypothetical protein
MITPIASMSAPSLAAPGARVALTAPRKSGIQAPRQYWLEPVVTWVTVSVRGDGWPDGDPDDFMVLPMLARPLPAG